MARGNRRVVPGCGVPPSVAKLYAAWRAVGVGEKLPNKCFQVITEDARGQHWGGRWVGVILVGIGQLTDCRRDKKRYLYKP